MTGSAEFFVLDVGHGNCSLIVVGSLCIVFDAGDCATLVDFLRAKGISAIDALFISHSDRDHMAGVTGLLASEAVDVRNIYVNPDAEKASNSWIDFRTAVADAFRRGVSIHPSLTAIEPGSLTYSNLQIDVLAPVPNNALTGPGGKRGDGTTISFNDHSAVLKATLDGKPMLLIPGDMTDRTWTEILTEGKGVEAVILLLPHHGGLFGRDLAVVEDMLSRVKPRFGIIANGRGMHDNPRGEIITRLIERNIRVACSQLSRTCGKAGNNGWRWPARGARQSACCAGTIEFLLASGDAELVVDAEHTAFVDSLRPGPLCR